MRPGKTGRLDAVESRVAEYAQTIRISGITSESDIIGYTEQELKVSKPKIIITRDPMVHATGNYNPGTYEFFYTNTDESMFFDLHEDTENRFQRGYIKLTHKAVQAEKGEEQTAIELQSETDGFLEFETPKWFQRWSELKIRIEEAVEMTKAISAGKEVLATDPIHKAIKKRIPGLIASGDREKAYKNIGKIVEWPFSTDPIDPLFQQKGKYQGKKLYVEILDDTWRANIQPSEGIEMSQYESLLDEHEDVKYLDATKANGKLLFNEALSYAKMAKANELNPGLKDIKEENLANLKGFLQMVANYLLRGQGSNVKGNPSKFAFTLLARTSFYSVYHNVLSTQEQVLFKYLVTNNKVVSLMRPDLKKMAESIYAPSSLKAYKDQNKKDYVQISGSTYVLREGHGGGQGPTISAWLTSIMQGGGQDATGKGRTVDKMSRPTGGSASMGRFDVETDPGKKDTGLVKFELRGSKAQGGSGQPATKWVSYAEALFKSAATNRSRPDIPDDPSTPDKDESTSTGLIYDPN